MNPDLIRAISEFIALALATVTAVRGGWGMWLRYKQNLAIIQAGGDPKSLPPIDERPLLWVAIAAGALAYLFSSHPRMAQRIIPIADSAELTALAAPVPPPAAAGCSSAADCASGCKCTGGQCTPCSAIEKKPKPVDRKQKPRLVASMDGTLCADCLRLPQMYVPVSQPFGD